MMSQREWLDANGISYDADENGNVTRSWSKGLGAPLVTANIETGGLLIREDFLIWMAVAIVVVPLLVAALALIL